MCIHSHMLGVDRGATLEIIDVVYRALVTAVPPDACIRAVTS